MRSTAVKPRFQNRFVRWDFYLAVPRGTVFKYCSFYRGFEFSKFVDRLSAMHPAPIYFHPLSMYARARIRQPIKNVTDVNE